MKRSILFLFAVVLVAAFSCRRADEMKPVPQAVDQPNDQLIIQDVALNPVAIAGSFNHSGFVDGNGSAARFNRPMGIFTKGDGSLLVADYGNKRIRIISISNRVTTKINGRLWYRDIGPVDIAEVQNGAYMDVVPQIFTVYDEFEDRGALWASGGCGDCLWASTDKSAGNDSFWIARNDLSKLSRGSFLYSFDDRARPLAPGISIETGGDIITSISVAKNDNKFITTTHQILECTHSGVVFNLLPGITFSNLTSIIANHDGSTLFVADAGIIKRITRCKTCKTTVTNLVAKEDAFGLALSNKENVLYFSSAVHHTVNKVTLP